MTAARRPYRRLRPWWRTLSTQALIAEYGDRLTGKARILQHLADRPKRLTAHPAADSETGRVVFTAALLTLDLELIHDELNRRHGPGAAAMIVDHCEDESHRAVPGQPIDAASTARHDRRSQTAVTAPPR